MSLRTATVNPAGLNLRRGPGTGYRVIGVLGRGQRVTIVGQEGAWRRVETPLGAGFVHGHYLSVESIEAPAETAAAAAGGTARAEDAVAPATEVRTDGATVVDASAISYAVRPGDTLGAIASRFGVSVAELAAANAIENINLISVNQVLRIPGSAGEAAVVADLHCPLPGEGRPVITASSASGHHRPFLGSHSCDLDVGAIASPGVPVTFGIDVPGHEARGVVSVIGPACRSGRIDDGGHKVQIRIEKRAAGGEWQRTACWVLYAHLDPVLVQVGDVVKSGHVIGRLGPANPLPTARGEYDSTCARGSHVHVEASSGSWVASSASDLSRDPVVRVVL